MRFLYNMSKYTMRALMGAALLGTAASLVFVGGSTAEAEVKVLDEAAVVDILRAEIARDPGFILEALNKHMERQQAQERERYDNMVVDARAEIAASEGRPFIGAENPTVELVYFFDVNCGYCKRLEPSIRRVVEENKDVRISHREIPILAESSRSAALLANIVWQMFPEKYTSLHEKLIDHQGALNDEIIEVKLTEVLGAADAARVLGEASNINSDFVKNATAAVQENLALAEKAGITGTPFVYVLQGDGLMRGAAENAYEQLTAFIEVGRQAK